MRRKAQIGPGKVTTPLVIPRARRIREATNTNGFMLGDTMGVALGDTCPRQRRNLAMHRDFDAPDTARIRGVRKKFLPAARKIVQKAITAAASARS